MSMYGMLFGQSKHADLLLSLLGLTKASFYRFRDCYLDEKGRIAIYTRGGGNNRDCYCGEGYHKPEEMTEELGGDKHAPRCVVLLQHANRKHACYIKDEDDDFDCTYATFYFSLPMHVDRGALEGVEPEMNRDEVWQAFLAGLHAAAQGRAGKGEK